MRKTAFVHQPSIKMGWIVSPNYLSALKRRDLEQRWRQEEAWLALKEERQ